jgi:transcriptional regulator with XRE-family HTH domain
MALREAFSANLTRLCASRTSIASICRATQINRQQFNRYLSGESLPNERNLAKICGYFGVDESGLFGQEDAGAAGAKDQLNENAWWSHVDLRAVLKLVHSDARPSIAAGIYFADFAVPGDRGSIVRSTIIIRNDGNLTTFRRLTGLAERRGSWWSQFHGDHKGLILERAHWLYLVGLNARGNREPSLIVLRWVSGSRPMLRGQALVMGPAGPTATAVVVNPCRPNMKLRTAVQQSHVYSTDDPHIEPLILDALEEQSMTLTDKTWSPDLSVRPLHPRQSTPLRQ